MSSLDRTGCYSGDHGNCLGCHIDVVHRWRRGLYGTDCCTDCRSDCTDSSARRACRGCQPHMDCSNNGDHRDSSARERAPMLQARSTERLQRTISYGAPFYEAQRPALHLRREAQRSGVRCKRLLCPDLILPLHQHKTSSRRDFSLQSSKNLLEFHFGFCL
jgi:hypothetical protein